MIFSTVPSGAPNGVEEVSTASNSITVGWEEVDCLLRNGMITGYTAQAVRNGVVEGTASVGGDARQATISGLESSTEYSVQAAAVNSAGIGLFSPPITIMTSGEYGGSDSCFTSLHAHSSNFLQKGSLYQPPLHPQPPSVCHGNCRTL